MPDDLANDPDLTKVWNRIAQRPFQAYGLGRMQEGQGGQGAKGEKEETEEGREGKEERSVQEGGEGGSVWGEGKGGGDGAEAASERKWEREAQQEAQQERMPLDAAIAVYKAWHRSRRMRQAHEALDRALATDHHTMAAEQQVLSWYRARDGCVMDL